MASSGRDSDTHMWSVALHLVELLSAVQLQCFTRGGAVSDVWCLMLCCSPRSRVSSARTLRLMYYFAWHGCWRWVVLLWLEAGGLSSVGQCQVTPRSIASWTVDLNTVPSPPLLCFNAQRHQILFFKWLFCLCCLLRATLPVSLMSSLFNRVYLKNIKSRSTILCWLYLTSTGSWHNKRTLSLPTNNYLLM